MAEEMLMSRTARRRVLRISLPDGRDGTATGTAGGTASEAARADMLAVGEPLEIRVGGEPLTVTMRTPGDDIDLAAGFLFCEGVIAGASGLASIRICGSSTPAGDA